MFTADSRQSFFIESRTESAKLKYANLSKHSFQKPCLMRRHTRVSTRIILLILNIKEIFYFNGSVFAGKLKPVSEWRGADLSLLRGGGDDNSNRISGTRKWRCQFERRSHLLPGQSQSRRTYRMTLQPSGPSSPVVLPLAG